MLDSRALRDSTMDGGTIERISRVLISLEHRTAACIRRSQLPSSLSAMLYPCNLVCIEDLSNVAVMFERVSPNTLPRHVWLDKRSEGPLSRDALAQLAALHRLRNPEFLHFSSGLVRPDTNPGDFFERMANGYIHNLIRDTPKPRALDGYQNMQFTLDAFNADHPIYEQNVFIAMRFHDTQQQVAIAQAIRDELSKYGLAGHRADDKMFASDGDIWTNVCVYMMGCHRGVFVLEQIDQQDFNPNVSLELGFMRATNRQCLLLKEKRMRSLATDVVGKLYRDFDAYKIQETVGEQVATWAKRDLGLIDLESLDDIG